jgi:hypothetical protein
VNWALLAIMVALFCGARILERRAQRALDTAMGLLNQAETLQQEAAASQAEAMRISCQRPVSIAEGAFVYAHEYQLPFMVTGYSVRQTNECDQHLTVHAVDPVSWRNFQLAKESS